MTSPPIDVTGAVDIQKAAGQYPDQSGLYLICNIKQPGKTEARRWQFIGFANTLSNAFHVDV
jgi:hypothetical protein